MAQNIIEVTVRHKDEGKAGRDQTEAGYKKIGDTVEDTDKRTSGFGTKLAKVGAVAAVGIATAAIGIGKALYDVGSTMNEMEDKIRVGTGASGQALDGLLASAKKVGTQVPSDFGQVSEAITALNQRLGLTGKPLEDMAAQMLNLSRITGTDVKSNIELLTRVFGDWSIVAADQPKALDAIFRASQATGVGVDQLAAKVVQFGAPLRTMGFTFAEAATMMGKFEKEGVNTDLVMGSLRIAVGKIAAAQAGASDQTMKSEVAQKKLNDALAKHGQGSKEAIAATLALEKAQKGAELTGKSAKDVFLDYVAQIKAAPDAMTATGIAIDLFGKKAGGDMADAIRGGRFELGALFDQVTQGKDTINAASLETMDFAEQWQLTKNRLMVAFQPAAAKVFGALGEAMEKLGPKLAKAAEDLGPTLSVAINALINTLTAALPVIQAVATVITALGPAATPIIGVLTAGAIAVKGFGMAHNVLDVLPDKWNKLAVSTLANFAKMTASALAHAAVSTGAALAAAAAWLAANVAMVLATGGIILAIAAVIAIVILIIKHWDWVKAKAEEVWHAVAGFFAMLGHAIADAVMWVINWVKEHWQLLLAIFMGPLGILIGLIIQHWDKVKAIFTKAINALLDVVKWLGRLPGMVIGYISQMVSGAINKAGELIGWFAGLGGRLLGAIGDIASKMAGLGMDIIMGIWHGIQNGWNKLVDMVQNLARTLLNAAKSAIGIHSPSKAFADEFGAMIPSGAAVGVNKVSDVAIQSVRAMAQRMASEASSFPVLSGVGFTSGAVGGNSAVTNGSNGGPVGPIVLQFKSGGTPIEEFLANIIRNYVKVQGGDVQSTFGRPS